MILFLLVGVQFDVTNLLGNFATSTYIESIYIYIDINLVILHKEFHYSNVLAHMPKDVYADVYVCYQ